MIKTGKLVQRIISVYSLALLAIAVYQFWRHPDYLTPIGFALVLGVGAAVAGSIVGLAPEPRNPGTATISPLFPPAAGIPRPWPLQ